MPTPTIDALRVIELRGDWPGRTFAGEPFPFVDRQVSLADTTAAAAASNYTIHSGPGELRQPFVELDVGGVTGRWGPIEHHEIGLIQDLVAPHVVGSTLAPAGLHDHLRRTHRHGRSGLLPTAISAVELALWDAHGLAAGRPVCELLGGPTRDRVPCYLSMLGAPLAEAADVAARWHGRGWDRQKWFFRHGPARGATGMTANVDLARRLRDALPEATLMFDASNGWDLAYAVECCGRIEELRPRWIEEPVVPEDVAALAELRRRTRVPVATGEHVYGRTQSANLLIAGAADVLQNDPVWTGGLAETLAVAHVAGGFNVPLVPHGHALIPALHVAAVTPPEVVPMLEVLACFLPERHWFLKDAPTPEAGAVTLPEAAGLGMTLADDRIAERRVLFELTA